MDFAKIGRDDWILSGVALLLAIALVFFPWFSISVTIGSLTLSVTATATESPDGWLGVLAMLCSLAVAVDLLVARMAPHVSVPALGGSRTRTRLTLAVAAAALTALKFVFHIHFSYFGWGFYLAVLLAVALVYLAWQADQGVAFSLPSRPRTGGHPPA
jgi:hypothetical protein